MQAAVLVVEPVQLLDQQVSPVRGRTHQGLHLQHCRLIGLASLKPTYFADTLAHVVQSGQSLGRAVGCQHIRSHGIRYRGFLPGQFRHCPEVSNPQAAAVQLNRYIASFKD